MTHILLAFFIQLAAMPFIGWWGGALAASFFYIGREIAQAEYRVINEYYNGKRANMPLWGAFQPRAWTTKSVLDWVFPTVSGFMIAWFSS